MRLRSFQLVAPGHRRIIPADAGSTLASISIRKDLRDHPRRCGEHHGVGLPGGGRGGSSPQMRGARQHRIRVRRTPGIIPADAGSTECVTYHRQIHRDHPRRCGEHDVVQADPIPVAGSSPQMRGARRTLGHLDMHPGIIPADAGSTSPWPGPRSRRWDHPRRCGEHTSPRTGPYGLRGSSPQMRGARRGCVWDDVFARIIPADAGSTFRF